MKMLASARQPYTCLCKCLLPKSQAGGAFSSVRKYENPNTAVFERRHKMQNCGIRKFPLVKKHHYVLDKLEPEPYKNTMQCILTTEVEDIGLKGTLVEVPKRLFRNVLYPRGDAVYASPENIELYEGYRQESEEEGIDYETKQLMKSLAGFRLQVFMNAQEKWTLNLEHVKISFRKMGVMLSEDNIILPEEPVSSFGDFILTIQMDNRIACKVRATVYPLGLDSLPDPLLEYPPAWDNEPVDPENPIAFLKPKNIQTESENPSIDGNENNSDER